MSSIYKLEENEQVSIGDTMAFDLLTSTVHKATLDDAKDVKKIVGVCVEIYSPDEILVCDNGLVDVNVNGIVCLGDHLTISEIPR